ncbi:mycofactocin biosynthesis peptidyl-dipeptidase MftE [Microbacterium sp. G2-8]|uniref:mycofactocin biosynthesis peptidyl-dipeptidase MftE n=1 Tax=Microbacterium sp. G2-8 TaxID=2842454 RepID=UPI001C88FE06|nr:mycofactocin biosynthesis peptidyl-dipeptidase MftE [Microbacterium sp. G2-8]
MSPLLADRAWPEVDGPPLVIPVGSLEQHGPHLPLDVDTVIATAVARDLSARWEGSVCAPAIALGASGEHQGFPGTVSIGSEVLAAVVREVARSASAWAGRIVFVSGHGGNAPALAGAIPELRADEERDVSWVPCAPDPRLGVADAHAGRLETSILLHLDPARVRTERAAPGRTEPIARLLPELRAGGVRAASPNGVLGDPTGASAAEGAELLRSMRDRAWERVRSGLVRSDGMCAPTGE